MSGVIEAIKDRVKRKDTRMAIYDDIIEAFEDMDCDTLGECAGEDPAFDDALRDAGYDLD